MQAAAAAATSCQSKLFFAFGSAARSAATMASASDAKWV